jgi:hypothetical protein
MSGLIVPPEFAAEQKADEASPSTHDRLVAAGQVPAWSELDERNLADRLTRRTKDGVRVGIVVPKAHLISIVRTPRGRCESCELRRVLYVVDVDGELTRRFCWACWSGGKPE